MAGKSAPSVFSVFRNRSFILLWAGQLVSSGSRIEVPRSLAFDQELLRARRMNAGEE